ncbi:polysaccharide deacetylase family sporulation protein PdaB [Desulforudis sp. DRI-14]
MYIYFFNFRRAKQAVLTAALMAFISFLFWITVFDQQVETVSTTHSRIIYKVKTDQKVAALTFDISWGEKIPEPVLDILKKENLKCTFFLSGPWAEQHPEIVRRIAAEGHEIASHGHRHVNYSELPNNVIAEEMGKAHEILKNLTGRTPNLIRTPNGDWNERVLDVISGEGYTAVQWSVDSLDWKDIGVERIVNRVLRLIHPGAIILMHASDSVEQTPEALPRIIKGLKEKGYKIVTVAELMTCGRGVCE